MRDFNPIDRLRRIAEEFGVDIEEINVEEARRGYRKEQAIRFPDDRDEVEKAFRHGLHYESHGGWGE